MTGSNQATLFAIPLPHCCPEVIMSPCMTARVSTIPFPCEHAVFYQSPVGHTQVFQPSVGFTWLGPIYFFNTMFCIMMGASNTVMMWAKYK